jgi:D-alanine-D-alanine ligase
MGALQEKLETATAQDWVDVQKMARSEKTLSGALTNGNGMHSKKTQISNATINSELPICYGPVTDLGSMVPALWWKTVFSDALYLKTDGDVVEDADITREEISLLLKIPEVSRILLKNGIQQFNVSDKPAKILDLCCGQGRHSLQLIQQYPHLRVHGHDQSSYLISLAKERSFQQSEKPEGRPSFTVGDCRTIPYPDNTFNLVLLMGNSFGYFSEDEQDRAVLAEIKRTLAPGGVLVLDLTDGEYMRNNFAERSWEWADETTFVCRERQLSKDGLRLNSREIISVTTKGVVRDQFYQERLYSRPEICTLLRSEGFTDRAETQEEAHVTLGEMSKRGEDLGMMANRMFVTAVKALAEPADNINAKLNGMSMNETQISKIAPPPFEEIVVLLGDTSKPCIGKLNNTWNNEDFETRKKLIKALHAGGIPSETVKIVEDHDTLHQYLIDNKPSFVFNLCDEGWNNDALKEAHVPSLLEMLEIPYSGAGPNCLAFCYDKGLVNRSAEAIGIETARELTFLPDSSPYLSQISKLASRVSDKIGFPAFVKPIKGDNSLGITSRSIVNTTADLESYMLELEKSQIRQVLVQEYLQGTEYGVGMIGNPETGFTFLPILEVDFSKIVEQDLPPILGYESKWDPKSPYWTQIGYKKVSLSAEVEEKLKRSCIALWERFNCRDYARFDFRCDVGRGDGFDGLGGMIKLLEVNPNPGWCWDGKFAYMAKLGGYEYSDMLNLILAASWARIRH